MHLIHATWFGWCCPWEEAEEGHNTGTETIPTSLGISSWVPSTPGCQGQCSQKERQTRGAQLDLLASSMQLSNRTRTELRNVSSAILTPCAAQSCWKHMTEKQSSCDAS